MFCALPHIGIRVQKYEHCSSLTWFHQNFCRTNKSVLKLDHQQIRDLLITLFLEANWNYTSNLQSNFSISPKILPFAREPLFSCPPAIRLGWVNKHFGFKSRRPCSFFLISFFSPTSAESNQSFLFKSVLLIFQSKNFGFLRLYSAYHFALVFL